MIDSYRHKGMRKNMLELLRKKGIQDEQVLEAMDKVPRHWFLDDAFLEIAYEDKAFPIGCEQTISQPYTVAKQSELLQIKKGDKVLEIGTGCGYQTSILFFLGAKVYSIERQKALHNKTKKMLDELRFRAHLKYGDGYKGLPAFGPFDKIIVTAGAPLIAKPLLQQLKIGGRLVIPVGTEKQIMTVIDRVSETSFNKQELGECAFVPMLEDKV
ncbi:MAG: protein-L-isoaspartate O-methyltransferase [Flavobacteriales bacterium]|nr:protein-L-isoaspartate O-methyltransferase [Flavobacteriales bacterium]|tara:strand:- start:22109 stop:22747 length:639 start_codon:yes stop_codon:yes gene_type:complete